MHRVGQGCKQKDVNLHDWEWARPRCYILCFTVNYRQVMSRPKLTNMPKEGIQSNFSRWFH